MSYARQSVERAISATTNYTESELADMGLDELGFVAEVLQHTDTDVDARELHSAITYLKNNDD